jgi:IstB-like ATP binding protein
MDTLECASIAEAITSFDFPVFPDTNRLHPTQLCCKLCNTPLEQPWTWLDVTSTDGLRVLARGWTPITGCDRCRDASTRDELKEAANQKFWEERCPVEFRKAWDSRLGSELLLRRVLQFDAKKGRGLIVVGQSGTSKTRSIWTLLRALSERGESWFFATGLDVMEGLPIEAHKASVLVIDDLGNDKLSANREVELLNVIRKRVDWHRPIIVTTQYKGKDLANRFSEGATAQAVVRRLREFCDAINVEELMHKPAA